MVSPFIRRRSVNEYLGQEEDPLDVAGRMYDPYRHDPDSIGFDDSYVGPSELELGGGCNRCGAPDDCYCNG